MIEVEVETTIARPPEDVFAALTDIERYADWLPPSEEFVSVERTSELPVREGTTYLDRTTKMTLQGVVTHFEPPRRVIFRERAPGLLLSVEVQMDYTLTPTADGGTRVYRCSGLKLGGLGRLFASRVAPGVRKENERILAALKNHLEADRDAATPAADEPRAR